MSPTKFALAVIAIPDDGGHPIRTTINGTFSLFHAAPQAQDQMQGGFLLDIVVA